MAVMLVEVAASEGVCARQGQCCERWGVGGRSVGIILCRYWVLLCPEQGSPCPHGWQQLVPGKP